MSQKRQVTYRVTQSSSIVRTHKPLNATAVQREYQLFGTFLQLLAKGDPHVSMTFEPATPAEAGLLITLLSDLQEPDLDKWMAGMLAQLNGSVEGILLGVDSKVPR